METLWDNFNQTATEKQYRLVQKLWTVRLPCGSQRKIEDECHRLSGLSQKINGLDTVEKYVCDSDTSVDRQITCPG
jgi:hypothetical protein